MARDRILFVDDEPQILQGLARMLRSMRHEWDVAFAESGAEALAMLDAEPFDVIVSDMRMPGMNGTEMLTTIATSHPSTVRLVLSGQAGERELMQAVNAAHQYMAKPCEPETLKAAIGRAAALRDLMHEEALVGAVSAMTSLPSFPAAYNEIMDIVNSDDPSLDAIADVVARDPGMTAKVLQLVNSSFFGFSRTIADVKQATSMLGVDRILSLVLGQHVFRELEGAKRAGVDLDVLWHRCAQMAEAARSVAVAEGASKELAGFAQVAGLLSTAGTLVLAAQFPDRYVQALMASGGGVASEEAELAEFGATSPQVGAYLLGLWGLPPSIVEAVAFYREPGVLPATEGFRTLTALHAAAALRPGQEPVVPLDHGYLESIGLSDRVPDWTSRLNAEPV